MKTIAIEKMTREQLRALPFGKPRTFELPAARDIINATSLIYRSQHVLGCRFTVRCDYEQLRMTTCSALRTTSPTSRWETPETAA